MIARERSESRNSTASATGAGSELSHFSGACFSQRPDEGLEAGDALRGGRLDGAGGDEVHAHVLLAEVTRQVARDRLERGLRHSHPVVDRPGDRGVEVHAHEAAAVLHQRRDRPGQRLERVRARAEGQLGRLGRRGHEVAAQGVAGSEGDRVKSAVEATPALPQLADEHLEVLRVVHVELEHVRRIGEPRRGALGHPSRAPEAGEHDLGSLLLRALGD